MSHPFLYGAATSAHQTEGNNINNDWWAWEMGRAAKWRSGVVADHYNRWRKDLMLAKELGHNAHRFSLEWSRIEPQAGVWDKKALAHYREVLEELRNLGIVPFVTLHHFTNPQWFAKRGGWLRADAAELFARYVKVVSEHLGDLVVYWITLNEPVLWSNLAYWKKRWPPQERSLWKLDLAIRHLAFAHKKAFTVLHRTQRAAQVGVAKHMISYRPARDSRLNQLACWVVDEWFNKRFYRLTGSTHDFLGVNYYFERVVSWRFQPAFIKQEEGEGDRSDLGWTIAPEGLRRVLLSLKSYQKPIFITENGLADQHDCWRSDFIRDHLREVEMAQASGVDVRGYFHWSLIDNFEWDLGKKPRFGLIAVDYDTLSRKPRPSAYVYKGIIRQARGE